MNKIFISILLLLTTLSTTRAYAMETPPPVGDSSCTYTLYLTDYDGDGWNGASVRITDLTTEEYTDFTIDLNGWFFFDVVNETDTFNVIDGHQYSISWNSGQYDYECSFSLRDNLGELVYEYDPYSYDPWGATPPSGTTLFVFTAICTDSMCTRPTNLHIVSHTPYTATLQWTNEDTSIHLYRLLYGTNENPDSMFNVTVNDFTYTLTNLSPDSTYHVQLSSMCDTNTYSRYFQTVDVFTGYCIPHVDIWYGSFLRHLSFGNIPGVLIDTVDAYEYADRHNQIGSCVAGDTLNISATFEWENPKIFVWVDWNNNYQFEQDEMIASYLNTEYYYHDTIFTCHLSYLIPPTCSSGNYRLRLVTTYSEYDVPDPCLYVLDARDYTLHVTGAETAISHIYFDSMEYGTISINGNQYFPSGSSVENGSTITITAVPNMNYSLQYLIVNNDTVNSPYTLTVTNDVYIQASFFPILSHIHLAPMEHGTISINGNQIFSSDTSVMTGSIITISVVPDTNCSLQYLVVNGDTVDCPWTITITNDIYIQAIFILLPDLHVTQISNTTPIANNTMQVTWTVRNDGIGPTPVGATWNDYIWIVQNIDLRYFDPDDQHGFLATVQNMQALDTGESYTNTATVTIPYDMIGTYYIFVLSDQGDASDIDFSETDSIPPIPYTPSVTGVPYHYATAGVHAQVEGVIDEIENHDNFFYKQINISAPPAADLVVANVTSPTNFFSGTTVNVTATIANSGNHATTSYGWIDRCYISHSDHYDSTALPLQYEYHDALTNTALQIGGTYQTTIACTIPHSWQGNSYFYVFTDASNSELEFLGENNNMGRSAMVNVILTPPADLTVTNVSTPLFINNIDSFAVNFQVLNTGLGTPSSLEWFDHIYLSTSPTLPDLEFNSNGADPNTNTSYYNISDSTNWCYRIGTKRHWELPLPSHHLSPGQSYMVEQKYMLPSFITQSRQLYVIVVADGSNSVFEYNREDNNSDSSTAITANIYYPDFVPYDILLPDTIVTGHTTNLNFTLRNEGNKNYFGSLNYRVLFSPDSVYHRDSCALLTSVFQYTSSTRTLPRHLSLPVEFPSTLTDSDYYIYLFVNPDSIVPETSIHNNGLRSGPYYICQRPLPDLVLCNVTIPDTVQAGLPATISFDIANNGENIDGRTASLYEIPCLTALIADTIWCPVQIQITPYGTNGLTLAVGDTQHYVQSVIIPPMMQGNITFSLQIDANNNIQELSESNNTVSLVRFVQPTDFDLAVQNISSPATYTTGDTLTLSWTTAIRHGTNYYQKALLNATDATGYRGIMPWIRPTSGNLWCSAMYLSADSIYSQNDILLNQTFTQSIPLDSTKTATFTTVMPHRLSGNIYLIARADIYDSCIERTHANNTLARPIAVALAPQPNLQVTALTIDDTVTQKQGCLVHYTIQNTGEGDIVNSYVSHAFFCGDNQLKTVSQFLSLSAGESYSDSVEIVIPNSLLGNYAFMMDGDYYDNLYESGREDDNSMVQSIVVIPAPPCDLTVTNITADASVVVGNPINISWVVQNIGENAIKGYIKDNIYLSSDTILDNNDVLIGTLKYFDTLLAHGSKQHSGIYDVQNGFAEGNYYVIVQTNVMRAFNEVTFSNNTGTATTAVFLSLPILVIGQEEQFNLTSGNKAYYKLVVGPELEGKTLSISLRSQFLPSDNGHNNIVNDTPSSYSSPFINQGHGNGTPCYTYYRNTKKILVGYKHCERVPCIMPVAGSSSGSSGSSGNSGNGNGGYIAFSLSNNSNEITIPIESHSLSSCIACNTEPRTIPVQVLIDHHLVYTYISQGCYNTVFGGQQTGTILNDNQSCLNGLYITRDGMSSSTGYEYGTNRPDDTAQFITIPSLRQGTYYFMTSAQSSGGVLRGFRPPANIPDNDYYYLLPRTENTTQSMRLLADIVDFEIIDVNTAMGSNTGSVTTKVTGARFDTVMDFRLTSVNGIYPASKVRYVNPSEAYVTFNLTDAPEGIYNMEAELPGGTITTKENAFVIGEYLPSRLAVNIVAPARVRVGQVTGINIEYSNEGASDLNVVGLLVRPSPGTYINTTTNPDQWENGDIYIKFPEVGEVEDPQSVFLPWSDQNHAPNIQDIQIPKIERPSSTPAHPVSGPQIVPLGNYPPAAPGGGGRFQFYTKPGEPGRGYLDAYPVYKRVIK
jgi:subtilase family serine protease